MAGSSLRLQTASRAVAEALRVEIEQGDLLPGARLRQNDLAARFGVSTTPVREALAYLEAEGILRVDPHRGAVVFQPTIDDLQQSFQIRLALEPLALLESLPHMGERDFEKLQAMVNHMRTVDDNVEWVNLNDEFHLLTYTPSNNQRLLDMIETLRKASRYYIHAFVVNNRKAENSDDEHQAILDACRQGDAAAADQALRAHLSHTVAGVIKYMERSAR